MVAADSRPPLVRINSASTARRSAGCGGTCATSRSTVPFPRPCFSTPTRTRSASQAALSAACANPGTGSPPIMSASSGRRRFRSATRRKDWSSLWGSAHTSSPSSEHAPTVLARRTPSSGRTIVAPSSQVLRSSMPVACPRRALSSNVSAWSSMVCPTQMGRPLAADVSAV